MFLIKNFIIVLKLTLVTELRNPLKNEGVREEFGI